MAGTERRAELLEGACDYVLAHSLAGLSLRPLAAALGTSDRMLIYHFGSRDGLVAAVLDALAARLGAVLATVLPAGRADPATVIADAAAVMSEPAAEPVMRVWVEMCGLAARGEEPFATEARRVLDAWVAWLAPRLLDDAADGGVGQDDAVAVDRAHAVLAAVDGLILLRVAAGRDVDAAARLLRIAPGTPPRGG